MPAICVGVELKVYDVTNTTYVATVPATGISFSKGLGGKGFLSFSADARAEPLATTPTLLDDCVIRVGVDLTGAGTFTQVAAYANRARNGILWDGAGRKTREVQQAPTLFTTWMQDALVFTEGNTIPQMAAEQRYFGYQSSIYNYATTDDAVWFAPTASTGKQNATTGDRAGNPDGWPVALGDAYWIMRDTGGGTGARHLFIADAVVPTDSYVTVYASADESIAVYFAGALVIQTSSSETGYQQVDTWSAWVTAGTYRVAIDRTVVTSRGGDGVDPVLLAVATNTVTGAVDDILLVTNATDWQCHAMHPVTGEAPSLTPGQIVLELLSQAQARNVATLAACTTDITATADSASVAWPDREERTWRIGYDTLFDALEGLGDLGFSPEITAGNVLRAWGNKGTDVSATVTIEALVNADSITESGVGAAATWLAVETQDGWVPDGLTNTAGLAAYGRREQALSLGNAPSVAQGVRLGQKVLDERLSRPTSEWSVEFYAVTGCVPFDDFAEGDTVAVKIGATSVDRVILDLGASAPSDKGLIRWTAKTGAVL